LAGLVQVSHRDPAAGPDGAERFSALDRSFRQLGGAPTYVLTDNEKTVTTMHVAGVPVRNQQTLAFAKHYSVEVLTCQPADPASKGGVESSVKIAKADLVPKDTNLRNAYASFAELEAACTAFMDQANTREQRTTRRRPVDMLAEEVSSLHRVPDTAHTPAHGVGRRVPDNTPMVSFENAQYSVPAHLLGAEVFARFHGTGPDAQVVIVHVGAGGRSRSPVTHLPGRGPRRSWTQHFPDHQQKVPGDYKPVPRSKSEAEFLGIGAGARTWLLEAAAAGAQRINVKMAEAVALAKIAGTDEVDKALGVAAIHHRFAHGDLASLLNAGGNRARAAHRRRGHVPDPRHRRVGRLRRHRRRGGHPMSITTANSTAPALPADLEALMRQLKMPHARAVAPDVLATARAQRWEPAEVIKALLAEEAKGRARSMLATRRKAAGFPTGKTFALWDEAASSIPAPTQQALLTLEWIHRKENLVVCGTLRNREDVLPRSPRTAGRRRRDAGRLVHPRRPRRSYPLAPDRRHRHPGRGPDPARRSGRHR
jgi:hypothetical protein